VFVDDIVTCDYCSTEDLQEWYTIDGNDEDGKFRKIHICRNCRTW